MEKVSNRELVGKVVSDKNDKTIKLVSDVIKKYLLKKEKYGYKINGLLCVSASKFEEDILNYSKFRLEKTLEESWYTNEENQIIKLSTPNKNSLWQIISIYTIPSESYYLTHTFENKKSYQKFIDTN